MGLDNQGPLGDHGATEQCEYVSSVFQMRRMLFRRCDLIGLQSRNGLLADCGRWICSSGAPAECLWGSASDDPAATVTRRR